MGRGAVDRRGPKAVAICELLGLADKKANGGIISLLLGPELVKRKLPGATLGRHPYSPPLSTM